MRIAVLILGLVFSIFSGLQSCAVHLGGRLSESTTSAGAGAVGILISMLFLIGSALVISFPRAAQVCFIISCVLAVLNRAAFPDMTFWAVVSFILGMMSYYGHRELLKRKKAMPSAAPNGSGRTST
jgi:uncharacterized membrane protein YjfL (UPF0719 family)